MKWKNDIDLVPILSVKHLVFQCNPFRNKIKIMHKYSVLKHLAGTLFFSNTSFPLISISKRQCT